MMMKRERGRVNRRKVEEMKRNRLSGLASLIEFRQLGESIKLGCNWMVPRHARPANPSS
jgi:hypothetical protein